MTKKIKTILYILVTFAIFYHILILTQIVDYHYAWGGQLQTLEQMYVFEMFSIFITSFFFILIYISDKKFNNQGINKLITFLLYFASILMIINTIGNIFAISYFEKFAFTPITLILSILFYKLVKNRKNLKN